MKSLLIFAFSLFLATASMAQSKTSDKSTQAKVAGAQITFEEKSHDFGDIKQGDKVEYTFKFKNTGTEPLILSNVQTTCGCTATEWTKEPVAPGKTGQVSAVFNSAGKSGKQNKVISVYSNAGLETVTIITNVLPSNTTAQP